MLTSDTWPTWNGGAQQGCQAILSHTGFIEDVQFGKTKLFIKTPKTVFTLESQRSARLPAIVLFLQKVHFTHTHCFFTQFVLTYKYICNSQKLSSH